MITAGRSYFLVGTKAELKHADAALADGRNLVAGSLHVLNQLTRRGYSAVDGGSVMTGQMRRSIVEQVGATAVDLNRRLATADMPEALRAIAMANMVKAMFAFEGMRAAETVLGAPILRLGNGKVVSARIYLGPRVRFAPGTTHEEPRPTAFRRCKAYELDFSSESGQKLLDPESLPRLHFRATSKPRWLSVIEGGLKPGRQHAALLTGSFPRLTAVRDRFAGLSLGEPPDPERDAVLTDVLLRSSAAFYTYRSGMRRLLKRRGLPELAIFNHVSHEGIAGCAAALQEAGVTCEMSSHGSLVAYGDGPRHVAAAMIANPIYNSFPGMARIVPRSPLQVRDVIPGQKIVRTTRAISASCKSALPEAFRLYYAPNFQAWHEAFYGLTIDCFQTGRCVEGLAAIVAGLPGFAMDLRIKTTANDVASAKKGSRLRGLLPEDMDHLFQPEAGVHDACWGSHKAYLAECDLVVTEGLTVVMFEALEMRKPVLLLNADALMTPSLPHRRADDLLAGADRAAVYAASLDDDLEAMLETIRRYHAGAPLTDDEIADYVWL